MSNLSANQLKQYNDEGFISPIDIFSNSRAIKIRKEIELIEDRMPGELNKSGRYNAHLISPLLDEVTHDSKILDTIQSVIGENILVCGTTLFIKNPNEKGFVSYHQDAKYIGLKPHNWVTAWVAITDSNEHNGCMRMWSGSHKDSLKDHDQMFNEGNLLTRGQTVNNVPIGKTIPLILKAGQMSLHHPTVVHGSDLNKSNDRRIGFVIQSYIGTNVKQVLGENGVQLARGVDEFNYHKTIHRPKSLLDKNDLRIKKQENDNLQKIFYAGSQQKGKY
ncbi:phytanoyl-CoA dioxygenase family protein [Candidatus Pelagibacter bacterium]|nr:phytanoyl-CoA dioxygenase family protein [Candidatus Pelagibacter bacterium]|tara:strand:+ start:270 stop:1097 length:828 start_codon:yes stop_codon:yes gene_type:complete